MKKAIILLVIIALPIILLGTTYTVKQDGTGDFTTITAALASVSVENGDVIIVYEGIYVENIIVSKNITLKSRDENYVDSTIIDGSNYPSSAVVRITSITNATLEGFTIINGNAGVRISNNSSTIDNCIITHNTIGIDINEGTLTYCDPIIQNCVIYENRSDGIKSYFLTEPNIIQNEIYSNGGHGIRCWGIPVDNYVNAEIIDNYIYSNSYSGIYGWYSDIESTGNVIYSNGDSGIRLYLDNSLEIDNCTIVDNVYGIDIYDDYTNSVTISNSIIWGNTNFTNGNNTTSISSIDYTCFPDPDPYQYTMEGSIHDNPLFEDPANNVFNLSWNETEKSPCIDTGDPASPFDPDGTPADMGALRAVDHDYHLTTAQHDRYRWRSFPVIDRNYVLQGDETTYICAPVEEQTLYFKIFNIDDNFQEWIEDDWNPDGDLETLDSVKGYKLQTTSDVEIPTSGRTLHENTRVYLDAGNNWVGYFIEESMTLQDAFAEIWDHITAIYSEDWAWANPGIPSNRCALVYGKMYNVRVDEACDFVYGEGSSVDPEEREMTEGFYYVETPDYSPINIESLDDPTVLEVGVFLDGECIGATQVEEFPLQILAFPLETPRGSGDITFEFYCGGRSYKPAKEYKVLNKETGHYDNSKIELRPYEFTTICFGNPVTPAKFTLTGNYPNPFNPSTTISYSIPSDGDVELIVYNIRGQKVKTLVEGSQPAGSYNVTWNGKDENDRSVSSGLYLYKLRSSGKIVVKKMLLLK